jgi:hypothetical protein
MKKLKIKNINCNNLYFYANIFKLNHAQTYNALLSSVILILTFSTKSSNSSSDFI